jgi:hypothetical protein
MPKGMQASILWPLAAATLLALLVVGTARAANSLSFPDRTGDRGDAYGGLDISGLQVSSDDGGLLTFRVTTVGHKRKLGTYDGFVDVLLDLDQNPDTGSLFYGAEVGLDLSSDGLGFQRLTGFKSRSAPLPPSLSGSFRDGVVTFTVKASDLGVAPGVGFNVLARAVTDEAPDYRTFNYQLAPGNAPPDLAPDTCAPVVHAFSSEGDHRYGAQLNYRVADGRGRTADVIRIYRGSRLIKEFRERLANTNPFVWYWEGWRIRHKVRPGMLHFCVRSTDAAGNQSQVSCAKLELT